MNKEPTGKVLALHGVVIDAVREIDSPALIGPAGDFKIERANEQLARAIERLAGIQTDPDTHAFNAKVAACRRYFLATECDDEGEVLDDVSLSHRLMWSVIQDLTR